MKVLVTGHTGFLGKHIWQELESMGVEAIGASLPEIDITQCESIERIVKDARPDAVIHSAAVADLYEADKSPFGTYAVNVHGTANVASAANSVGATLIYISTCCVYGNNATGGPSHPVPHPTERYAWTKLAGESVAKSFNENTIIARIPTLYGPGMRESLFIYQVIDAIHHGRTIEVHGDGHAARQYGYVTDVAREIVRIAVRDCTPLRLAHVNLNPPSTAVSQLRVIHEVMRQLDMPASIKFADQRKGQIMTQSIPTIIHDYTSFYDGISETIKWYRSRNGS